MKSNSTLLPYGRQWIDDKDIKSVVHVLRSDFITQGPTIEEFENRIAQYCGVKYAVCVNSGTAALHCAMFAIGIEEGDEVILPPLTFAATANAVVYLKGKPVFADIDSKTLCLDIAQVENKITSRTKAIAPVDFAGYPMDIIPFRRLAQKHNLKLVEDAAHALGAKRNNIHAGSQADAAILSFHPVKLITTGEGGAIITNEERIYKRCLLFRSHGMTKDAEFLLENHGEWYYEMHALGFNYRVTDFQCALGLSQLNRIEQFIRRRNVIAELYKKYLGKYSDYLSWPEYPDFKSIRHAYHLFVVCFKLEKFKVSRKEIYEAYRQEGIGVQVHYIPIHLQPFYKKHFGYKPGDFPVAERYYEGCLSLPMFPLMKESDVRRVVRITEKIIEKYKA